MDTAASRPKPRPQTRTPRRKSEEKQAGKEVKEVREVREVKEVKRATVVDIDSVRSDIENSFGLLEAAQDDGLKRRSLSVLEWLLMVLVLSLVLLFLPLSIWFCVRVVREHERAVVFRLGHLLRGKPRGPGLLFFLPILDVCHVVDVRLKTLQIPLHTVVTKDLLQWELSAVCYYQLENVALCSGALCSLEPTLQALVRGVIRDVLAQHSLTQAVGQRRKLGQNIQTAADALLCRWGIRLERTDIEELILPVELQRRLHQEARPHPPLQVSSRAAESDGDPWDGLRSSLRLLRPALVLPLPPDLLNVTSDPSPLPPPPPPPPPVAMEMGAEDSSMM
ncbi:podocin [Eucyclogobius newberryi]|uniref:podocin n=1 Tax=Eucyclogobius newberryi TaxID=166745 RepID=UPI003B5A5D09